MADTVAHEHVHKVIFESYDINSTIKYHWNVLYNVSTWGFYDESPIGTTTPEKRCPTEFCEIQHNVVEMINYALQTISGLVLMTLLFIVFKKYIDELDEEMKNKMKKVEEDEEELEVYEVV